MGLPLELDVQKEETMRALLILLVFVLYDAQLAIEEQVPFYRAHNRSMPCHLGLWVGSPASSREKQDHIGIRGLGGPPYGGSVDLASTRSPYRNNQSHWTVVKPLILLKGDSAL